MAYILFTGQKIHGIYETEELLKANCRIFAYELLKLNQLRREVYFEIVRKLLPNEVTKVEELQKIVALGKIMIERYPLQKDGNYVLNNIKKHVSDRFDLLEDAAGRDSRVKITIPGNSAIDNMLITSEIEDVWRSFDKQNYTKIITELRKLIMLRIQKLEMKFPGRINFGNVSNENASSISYQVWPADMSNWNLPKGSKIFGSGFALCFTQQTTGVYGIVTNPIYGYEF